MDKLLDAQKEIKRIYFDSTKAKMERYNDLKRIIKSLSKEERVVLYVEYQCDFEGFKRWQELLQLLTFCLAIYGFIVSSVGLLYNKVPITISEEDFCIGMIAIGSIAIFLILMYTWISSRKNKKIAFNQYVIKVFETIGTESTCEDISGKENTK